MITRIKLFIDNVKELLQNDRNIHLKKGFLHSLPFWIGAFITGAIAVLYTYLFSLAEKLIHYIYGHNAWLFFIISPIAFITAWWIIQKFAPFARGSGIPQVSAAIEISDTPQREKVKHLLGLKVILSKILSSCIMLVGGGAIGREGPTIQIAASIFKKINEWLPSWYPRISKRNMIITGAAAGLASAFNTPLGGIVFAIEELTKTHFSAFRSALLTGVIIAGLTALNLSGPYLYLGYPDLANTSLNIVFIIIPIAIATGFFGALMGKIILALMRFKSRFQGKFQQVVYLIFAGLLMASLAYFVDERVLGSGKGIMESTLFTEQKNVEWYIPILRFFGPIISFTTGAAGGIFAPSLSAGASIGSAITHYIELSAQDTNLIILCSMVGFLTGITRSPFTSSILAIEMTNTHNIIFHLMLAALFANIISSIVSRHSFYDNLKFQYLEEINKMENETRNDNF